MQDMKSIVKRNKERRKNKPWVKYLESLRHRCNYIGDDSYKYYGGRGIKALITLKEIEILWFRDKAYLLKEPSIDRKDSNANYTFENCRFRELKDNCQDGSDISKKQVLQFNLNGKLIKEWSSVSEAARSLKIKITNISAVALNKYGFKTAGGFKWSYQNAR
jgi:hypothetical protein